MTDFTLYCDSVSDELLAKAWNLRSGPLSSASVVRLPTPRSAPAALAPLLRWERPDWVISDGERVRCVVEFSGHGYTGDNSFQRFARIYRAATLGIPVIYFTPFNRTRLNEIDDGRFSPRNVAPELFQTMLAMSERLAVPCMAIHWPTTDQGTPAPLHLVGEPAETLVRLVHFLVAAESSGSNGSLPSQFHDAVEAMVRQAALPWRGSATRTRLELPVDITRVAWIWSVLPSTYFSSGKVDKVLAAAALRQRDVRPLVGVADHFWKAKGSAVVQYIGYQWRPDPASGLIALSAGLAVASGLPLIVVWPRVFSKPGPEQVKLRESLARFKATGRGPLTDLALELGFLPEDIARFRARVSTDPDQFGTFGPDSKVGRILKDTAKLVVFGDAVVAP